MRSKLPERFGCSPILRTINKNAVGVLAKDPGRNKYIIEINILVDLTHTHIRAHIHTQVHIGAHETPPDTRTQTSTRTQKWQRPSPSPDATN